MDKINTWIFEKKDINNTTSENIKKIIKYGFRIIDSNCNANTNYFESNINLRVVEYTDTIATCPIDKFNDCLVWYIHYNSLINFKKDSVSKYYQELEMIKTFPKFSKYILIIDCDNAEQNQLEPSVVSSLNEIFGDELNLCFVNVNKALNYLALMYDSIDNIQIELLDTVLRDEFGKQIFKKLDSLEKKQKQILQLIKKEEIINDWIGSTGVKIFVDVLQSNIINEYSKIIISHGELELKMVCDKIYSVNKDNLSIILTGDFISGLINSISKIVEILNLDLENFDISNDINSETNIIITITTVIYAIIEYIKLFEIADNLNEHQINLYLNSINKLINIISLFKKNIFNLENNSDIFVKKNELIKKKLLLRFDEQLFNELLNSKEIDIEFFKQCVVCCLNYNVENFTNLIVFSNSYSHEYSEIIINEFINMELKYNPDTKIDLESFNSCIKTYMKNYLDKKTLPNTIVFSKLIFKITCLYLKFSRKYVKASEYFFSRHIKPIGIETIKKSNVLHDHLFLHYVYYNYKLLVDDFSANTIISNDLLIGMDDFLLEENFPMQIITEISKMLNNTDYSTTNEKTNVEYDEESIVQSVTQSDAKSNSGSKSDKSSSSDSDDSSNSSDSDDSSASSDSNNKIIKTNKVQQIYAYIKKSTQGRHLKQTTIKKICEMYWDKTKSYSKSIKLYQNDVKNKTFTKIYKEMNSKKEI